MDNRDWERFGEEIRRSVQDAVDSQDFSRLNQTITDTVNGAADYFAQGVRSVGDIVNENIRVQKERNAYRYQGGQNEYRYSRGGYRYQGDPGQPGAQYEQSGTQYEQPGAQYERNGARSAQAGSVFGQAGSAGVQGSMQKQFPALYSNATSARVGGMTLSLIGYIAGGTSAVVALIVLITMLATKDFSTGACISLIVFAVLTAAFGVLAGIGTRMRGNVKRFRSYIRMLGEREYCNIKELAEHLGKSQKFITKDLEKMISKGWFRQGHLDTQKTCLMVSHDAYKQYTALVDQMEQKKREENAAQKDAAADKSDLSPEVREVIQAGEEYIRKIHECNDAIPGEEISAKISRMEMLIDRIFDRVEQNPESVSDLHRMMEYYLPTTVKLLEAYEELDAQPVQGENIISSKQEIEKTLDTLNAAFEKLLDDLFQDTAWDVSSDISVLHTMLAQEGLTGRDFENTRRTL